MSKGAALIAILALCGCSGSDEEPSTAMGTSKPTVAKSTQATAALSCTVNGQPIGLSGCFLSGQDGGDGDLKVKSGGEVHQYTSSELAAADGPSQKIPLIEPYDVTAQVRGEQGYVLRLAIERDGQTIFKDETTEFGVVDADSATIAG